MVLAALGGDGKTTADYRRRMNKLLMGLMTLGVMTLTACSKPADRGAEIDALNTRVDQLEKAIRATKNDVHDSTKSIIDGLATLDLVSADGKPIPRWWCLTNSACVRSKDACEKSARKMIAAGAPIVCHPVRVAFCETKTPQCWADLEACSLGGGPCSGVE